MKKTLLTAIMVSTVLVALVSGALFVKDAKATPKTITVPDDYPTIQWAVGNASAGDSVFVRKGIYYATFVSRMTQTILIDKPLSLIGEDPQNTIIVGIPNSTIYYTQAILVTADNVTISGFTINGGSCGIQIEDPSERHSPLGCKIIGDNIMNSNPGILARGAINLLISGNNITGNSERGMYLSSSYVTVTGNNITGNGWEGIFADGCANLAISGNNITQNVGGGVFIRGYGPFDIYANNITDNQGYGVTFGDNCNNSTVHDNNIMRNSIGFNLFNYPISGDDNIGSGNVVYRNNIIDNSQQATIEKTSRWAGNSNQTLNNSTDIVSWDNGTQGNYWNDYFSKYPNAKEIDNSEIGNTPYIIDANNADNHPLTQQVSINATFPFPVLTAPPAPTPSPTPNPTPTPRMLPPNNAEYANGTIVPPNFYALKIWYDWVNVSGTQVINYAAYATPDNQTSIPIVNVIGQRLHLSDGTDVFVASALDGMEIYRDLNGNGIPDTNSTSGENEILYFMYANMSQNYVMTPIQKIMQGDIAHYTWAMTYENVDAFVESPDHTSLIGRFNLNHIALSYDFSVNGNISKLKSNFDIAQAENIQVWVSPGGAGVSGSFESSPSFLNGLSLSLLYATATYASKSYSTLVNDQLYNSSTAQNSVNVDLAQVQVNDAKAYDFVFGGNYTVNRNGNSDTYTAKAEATAVANLPINVYGITVRSMGYFIDELNLTDLFGGSWPSISTDYASSSLIYRVCFPVWDGNQITNDPVYVGYLASNNVPIPEIPITQMLTAFFLIAVTIALIATIAISKRHKRKA